MKRTFSLIGVITILSIILAACGGQTGRTDTRGNLADLREDMQRVIQTIDEAIATNDISEFKNKTDDAVSKLDNRIDDFLDEMDNANRQVDHNTRNRVIQMKQKKVEVEFKLALLEQDDYDNWGTDGQRQDRTRTTGAATGTATDRDRATTAPQATTPDRTTTTPGTTTDRTTATDPARTPGTPGTGIATDERRRTTDRDQREIIYGPQLVDDIKDDLRDLRNEVEQFMQASLDVDGM
jgi:ElaB/YqjD/DUF883 family membrane-anchored ribosome-binding protein